MNAGANEHAPAIMKTLLRVDSDFHPHWVGDGFPVSSLFSYRDDTAATDPFLLLDYAPPYEFRPGTAPRGVGEHPHRGFETVTVVYQGELEHRDSAGHHGSIGPGDVQWMTAASGVLHQEFHSAAFTKSGGTFEVAQLWVNLPAKLKMSAPRYQDIRDADIPHVSLPGGAGTARVIAGELLGARGPGRTFTPITLCDLRLLAGTTVDIPLPDGFTTMLVVQHGVIALNGADRVGSVSLATFDRAGDRIRIDCEQNAVALLLCGEPIGEPVVGQGPFVMNTMAEIRQAVVDFQSGAMGRMD
jgi:redox-sensitive bicupin YhaK (pirin superfamily)